MATENMIGRNYYPPISLVYRLAVEKMKKGESIGKAFKDAEREATVIDTGQQELPEVTR